MLGITCRLARIRWLRRKREYRVRVRWDITWWLADRWESRITARCKMDRSRARRPEYLRGRPSAAGEEVGGEGKRKALTQRARRLEHRGHGGAGVHSGRFGDSGCSCI